MSASTSSAAVSDFEHLHIYQRAREMTNAVYAQTRCSRFAADYALVGQIRHASVSVMSNIAEGFERGTTTEFVQFLYIAKGSCGEVRAQLQVALDQGYITADAHASLVNLARMLSGMITNFVRHLKASGYRGAKFSRPQPQAEEKIAKSIDPGRAPQQRNIRPPQNREP